MRNARGTGLALAAAILGVGTGCFDKTSSDPDSGPAITSVAILPADGSIGVLYLGDEVVFTVTATYSDGSSGAVEADWTASGPEVTLSAATGASVTATGVRIGQATVTAAFGGLTDQSSIYVEMPTVPLAGVYGNDYGGLLKYPADGGEPTRINVNVGVIRHSGQGCVLSPDGAWLYFLCTWNARGALARVSTADTSIVEAVADFSDLDRPFGLDHDSAGRVYANGFGNATLARWDPATYVAGAMVPPKAENLGESRGGALDFAIGPDDGFSRAGYSEFYLPMLANGGSDWVYRRKRFVFEEWNFEMVTGFASAPPTLPGNFVTAGVAVNAQGEAFMMDCWGDVLYKARDMSNPADGLATEPGETVGWARFPHVGDTFTYGISVVAGGGVLVNRQPRANGFYQPDTDPGTGIFLVRDLNGDGDAMDPGEVALYNERWIYNGLDGGCVTAPR